MDLHFTDEDFRFVREEAENFFCHYDREAFRLSCVSHSRLLIECHKAGAKCVAQEAIFALKNSKPLSMIRIGDGEANIFGFTENNRELKWLNAIFHLQDAQCLSLVKAQEFSRDFLRAIHGADFIGLRAFHPAISAADLSNDIYIQQFQKAIEGGNLRGALGMIRALQFGKHSVERSIYRNSVIISAWVYFGLLEELDHLLENASAVIVITGRPELKDVFSDKLQERLKAFLIVPTEAGGETTTKRPFHYPTRFNEILSLLENDLRGTLVLVGAGIFGKIYCATAKQNGAVALDLGSGFDILAGEITRPVHRRPGLVDLEKMCWIKRDRSTIS